MAKLKAALALGAIAAAGVGTYSLLSADDEAAGTKNLTNQVWVERMPQNSQDMIGHMLILEKDGQQYGIIGRSSNWRHFIEVFGWRLENDRLKLFFPQERVKAEVKARTWRCEGEAPEPFDLCLELSQNSRTIQFYSRTDWEVKDADSLEALRMETPELDAVFGNSRVNAPTSELDFDSFEAGTLPLQ